MLDLHDPYLFLKLKTVISKTPHIKLRPGKFKSGICCCLGDLIDLNLSYSSSLPVRDWPIASSWSHHFKGGVSGFVTDIYKARSTFGWFVKPLVFLFMQFCNSTMTRTVSWDDNTNEGKILNFVWYMHFVILRIFKWFRHNLIKSYLAFYQP